MKILENLEPHVETDEVDQLEGTRGVIQSEFQRLVDVFGRGNSRLKHVESFVANQCVDARGDKTGSLVDDDDFLAHAASDFAAGSHRFIGRMPWPDQIGEVYFT